MGARRTRRRGKAGTNKGGAKSILRKQRSSGGEKRESGKTKKSVKWHPDVRSPKKIGRTRAQTRRQRQRQMEVVRLVMR
jgi:hypothetical protein